MSQFLTVNIAETIGQESAIEANGGPVFTIKVTSAAVELPPTLAGEPQSICGFGRVVSGGPVNGHEILYTIASVVPEVTTGLRHKDGLVVFA